MLVILAVLLGAAAFAPMIYTQELLFPFITSKAFFFRTWILLAVPCMVWLSIAGNKKISYKNPIVLLVASYLLIAFLAGVFGLYPGKSMWSNYERMTGVFYLFTLSLYFYGLVLLSKLAPKIYRRVLFWHIGVALLATIYGFLVGLGMTGFFPDPSLPRLSSMFGNPIFFASFLIVPVTFSVFFALEAESGVQKIAFYIFAGLFVLAALLTGTRGALVGGVMGILAGFIFVLFTSRSKKVKKWSGIGLGGVFIALVLLFVIGRALPETNNFHRVTNLFDTNSSSRLIQWTTALQGFKEYPILGVGPENYNVIANYYYDARQFTFDRSWFDKPHNYLLEVLTTTGIIGFLVYAALFLWALWEIRKAVKEELISSIQGAVLFAGIIAYQVQNLFVFDTISASITIFCLLSFIAYLHELRQDASVVTVKEKSRAWASSAAVVAGIFVLYGLYASVAMPYKAAVALNYGYAYGRVDAVKANEYFQDAIKAPFQFDTAEVASKYAEFATGLVSHPAAAQNAPVVNQMLTDSINLLHTQLDKAPQNAILWYQLAIALVSQASFNQRPFPEEAFESINQARELSYNRPEIINYQAQMLAYKGENKRARELLEQAVLMFPKDYDTRWRLALAYADDRNYADAIKTSQEALELGLRLKTPRDFDWLIGYYTEQKNNAKVIETLNLVAQSFPQDAPTRARLAQAYFEIADYVKAREIATSILQIDANSKADVDTFLAKLPK